MTRMENRKPKLTEFLKRMLLNDHAMMSDNNDDVKYQLDGIERKLEEIEKELKKKS